MSKKTDVKKEEEAKVEAPAVEKPKQISVEMTQEQLDEFVKFKAKQDEERELLETPMEVTQEYDVHCLYEHNINGRKYGPGKTRVPEQHIGLVMHGENAQRQQEVKLMMSSKRMFQVLENGQAVPVPVKG